MSKVDGKERRRSTRDTADLAVMRSRVIQAIVASDQALMEKEVAALPDGDLMRLFLGLDLRAKGAKL